jgi:hypothetical protein
VSRTLRLISTVSLLIAASFVLTAGRAHNAKREPRASIRPAADAPQRSLAVIVNKANPVENLSFAELRQYFLGERTHWPNGRRVTIVMRDAAQPERDAVLRIIYEMREQDFHAHFLHAQFTGEALEEPRVLDTASRVVNFVFLQPGAIGYVRAGETGPSVKVVRVDGLVPGDADYKLTF